MIFIKTLLRQKHIHVFLAYLGTLILIPPLALSEVYTGNNTIDIFAIHWLWQFEKIGNFVLKLPPK